MNVRVLPQAEEDLDHIKPPVLPEILRRIRLLARFPLFGAPMDGQYVGFRSTVVKSFRIVYEIKSEKDLVVVYIRHCRRDMTTLYVGR